VEAASRFSPDGTWDKLLREIQADADAAGQVVRDGASTPRWCGRISIRPAASCTARERLPGRADRCAKTGERGFEPFTTSGPRANENRGMTMRFTLMVKATTTSKAGALPKPEDVAAMGNYHEELVKAGILLVAGYSIHELVDGLEGRLDDYYPLPSARGDLRGKLGRPAEARDEFERAARLTANERQCDSTLARAQECA